MSKKDIDFNKLGTPKISEQTVNEIDTEKAVAIIHEGLIENEKTKRVTIDLPFSIYVEIKQKIASEERTMKDYFIELARKELKS